MGNLSSYNPFAAITSFGDLASLVMPMVFTIAGIAVLFYFVVGIFKLIISEGDKNAVDSARNMITHAVIGLILLIVVFLLVQYLPEALGLVNYKVI